jgi:hypothetical protein
LTTRRRNVSEARYNSYNVGGNLKFWKSPFGRRELGKVRTAEKKHILLLRSLKVKIIM